ncbi:predicted protein, partial [Nematostella vectensis]
CLCPEGFSGDKCENHDNECQSSPCKNSGTCKDEDNGYTCACVPGFTDKNCETGYLQACKDGSFTCSNGGTCEIDCKTLVPRCLCPEGFSGDKCES